MNKKRSMILFLTIIVFLQGLTAFSIKTAPENVKITIDGKPYESKKTGRYTGDIEISPGKHSLEISAKKYDSIKLNKDFSTNDLLEISMKKKNSPLKYLKTIKTGVQPKSVEIIPGTDFCVVCFLKTDGVSVYNFKTGKLEKKLEFPDEYAKAGGFVESLILTDRNELWISQMNKDRIHVFSLKDFSWLASSYSGGSWPKIIIEKNDKLYVSNWIGKNIGVVDAKKRKITDNIAVNGIPRGMKILGSMLYVCYFDTGVLEKIDLSDPSGKTILKKGPGAKRHMVYHSDGYLFYSDMYYGRIGKLNTETDKIEKEVKAGWNVNTIKLSTDEKYVFVSVRGMNNKESYMKKGPEFGKVMVFRTDDLSLVTWQWGGNQPTGLAVSEDGYVLSTNFLDHSMDIYQWKPGQE